MEFILGCIYFIVTGAVIYSMAALFLRGEKSLANRIYIFCQLMVAIWCSSQLLLIMAREYWQLVLCYAYGNIGICFAGASWVCFSLFYNNKKKVAAYKYMIPFGLSLIQYIFVITNGLHHLYYTSFGLDGIGRGVLFFVNVDQTYIFIIIGAIILFKQVRKTERSSYDSATTMGILLRKGSLLTVLAVIIPLVLSVVYLSGVIKADFDFTSLGFAISVILVRLATEKYQFFDMKRELAITNEKLLLEKERNHIAQQVHDTAGHTLTMIQSYMKLTQVAVKNGNEQEALLYLEEGRVLVSQGIKELRESINQLRQGETYELVTQAVMQLASQVKELRCEVTIQGKDEEKYSHLTKTIYDTVRESITNTLKYASASKIDIVIRFQGECVEVMIADDGAGCESIVDNNGLKGIKERVAKRKGSVRFITASGEGFMTRVKLPI